MVNVNWPTAVAGEADIVSTVSASACHISGPIGVFFFFFEYDVYLYGQIQSTKKPGIMTNYGYVKQKIFLWSLQNR